MKKQQRKQKSSRTPKITRKTHSTSEAEQKPRSYLLATPEVRKPIEATSVAEKKAFRDQFRESHKKIQEQIVKTLHPQQTIDIVAEFRMSKFILDEYVTLDWQHYEDIIKLIAVIRAYTKDATRRRPLNIIMQAEPGSGKSHFIKSLAKRMAPDGISAVTFNMSSFRGVDDFIQPLEAVRNIKVVDRIPLLFLDEFDSEKSNFSTLLPLLWDGELNVGHLRLRIGKVVTILAGSGKEISEVMNNSKGMQLKTIGGAGKLPDLLSRINGGELAIPDLDDVSDDRDRRVDKVCLTIALLTRRFASLSNVPWAFLRFVAETRFRYGVRSLSHLIDLIPAPEHGKAALDVKDLKLPLNDVKTLKQSSLAYHIIAEDGPAAVVENWKNLKSNEVSAKFKHTEPFSFTEFLSFLRKAAVDRIVPVPLAYESED
jgi:DNA replication protein DnaC